MSLPVFVFPIAVLSQYFFGITLFVLSVFLVLLILVQQGRGGGLTGALGGPGGQSAFGTKAGDVFTKITIITASIWIVLSAITVRFYTQPNASSALSNTTVNQTSTTPINVTVPPPGVDGALNPSTPAESMEAAPGTSGATTPEAAPSKETSAAPTGKAEIDPKSEAPLTFDAPESAPAAAPQESTPAPASQESTPPAQTPSADGAAEQPKP